MDQSLTAKLRGLVGNLEVLELQIPDVQKVVAECRRQLDNAEQVAATLLSKRDALLRQIQDLAKTNAGKPMAPSTANTALFDTPVRDLVELSVRTRNCLAAENVYWLGDLVQQNEAGLLKVPNLGKRSLVAITAALTVRGLSLGTKLPDWKRPE